MLSADQIITIITSCMRATTTAPHGKSRRKDRRARSSLRSSGEEINQRPAANNDRAQGERLAYRSLLHVARISRAAERARWRSRSTGLGFAKTPRAMSSVHRYVRNVVVACRSGYVASPIMPYSANGEFSRKSTIDGLLYPCTKRSPKSRAKLS